jgi:hypothetical protein
VQIVKFYIRFSLLLKINGDVNDKYADNDAVWDDNVAGGD